MAAVYDMCVDYDTLCMIEDKLQKVEYDLQESTKRMNAAIQRSQDFLAGKQFEKAKNVTMACTTLTSKTEINIMHARDYIETLRIALEDYGMCVYAGEI